MTGNIFKLLKADTKADLAEAVKSTDAGAKVGSQQLETMTAHLRSLGSSYSRDDSLPRVATRRLLLPGFS